MSTVMIADGVRAQAAHVIDTDGVLRAQMMKDGQEVPLPVELNGLLLEVLEHVAAGKTVQLATLPDELTPASAAEQLGVSRPTVMKWIRQGELGAHKVGSHHRLKTDDVMSFKKKMLQHRAASFEALRDADTTLGLDVGE